MHKTRVRSLGGQDPLEEKVATHSSILAWRIAWTEESGRLQDMGLYGVGQDCSDLAQTGSFKTLLWSLCHAFQSI